jgi:hypothetical protein
MMSRETLIAAIAACEAAKDYASQELFEDILKDTEEHIDWLETQLDVCRKLASRTGCKARCRVIFCRWGFSYPSGISIVSTSPNPTDLFV